MGLTFSIHSLWRGAVPSGGPDCFVAFAVASLLRTAPRNDVFVFFAMKNTPHVIARSDFSSRSDEKRDEAISPGRKDQNLPQKKGASPLRCGDR